MMKFIGNKSLIEFPIDLLRKIFPIVNAYYEGHSRHRDAYEHFYGGFIAVLLSILLGRIDSVFLMGIPAILLGHVFLKEIVFDMLVKKNKFHKVDFIVRLAGVLAGLPFLMTI